MVMSRRFSHTLKKLWGRYNPRRKFIDCDEELIVLMSQLGYVELYRGEWFFTDEGLHMIMMGLDSYTKSYGGTE